MVIMIRWFLFLLVGFPLQLLIYLIYPLLYFTARIFWQKHYKLEEKTVHQHASYVPPHRIAALHTGYDLFVNGDDHNLFTQYPVARKKESFQQFIKYDGPWMWLTRTPKFLQSPQETNEVSGDCVISWCFAAAIDHKYKMLKDEILGLTRSYMAFLGNVSFDSKNFRTVSARCNNFGLNWCPDGWLSLGQPMFGPNFYTNSALLALAATHSVWWRIVFWIHWWLLGGWFWAFMPAIYPPYNSANGLWYVRDMIMKALWVHKVVFGPRWWIMIPMRITNATTPAYNVLFEVLLGRKSALLHEALKHFPQAVQRFWSQTKNAASNPNDDGDLLIPDVKDVLKRLLIQ